MITIGIATRQGTRRNNADAAAIHRVPGTRIIGAAIVDGIGHHPLTPDWAHIAAEVAARVGPRKTAAIGHPPTGPTCAAPKKAPADRAAATAWVPTQHKTWRPPRERRRRHHHSAPALG